MRHSLSRVWVLCLNDALKEPLFSPYSGRSVPAAYDFLFIITCLFTIFLTAVNSPGAFSKSPSQNGLSKAAQKRCGEGGWTVKSYFLSLWFEERTGPYPWWYVALQSGHVNGLYDRFVYKFSMSYGMLLTPNCLVNSSWLNETSHMMGNCLNIM